MPVHIEEVLAVSVFSRQSQTHQTYNKIMIHVSFAGYEETLCQFTLKKFLLLVYFLDRAKLTRLIDHDPCLFCKDSEYKVRSKNLMEIGSLFDPCVSAMGAVAILMVTYGGQLLYL